MELSKMEKLAVCQAFIKSVGEKVETGNPRNLRGEVDREMIEAYEQLGCKSFDVKLLGRKVGTYTLTVSKPKPSKERVEYDVVDEDAFNRWAFENGYMVVDSKRVLKDMERTGELPDGCEPITVVEAGYDGGEVTRTTLRVDTEQVARALGPQLEPVAQLLLEGGEDV